ncbi:redox-sensing transcriptional repressor Rex [Nocardia ninae]|uniref:Redox-sensing transcriptional repressor Rex n=1 Tax=Nocardia ninae NBRC 108245 TaxID=1210091 RepID=A0A511MUB2_9NOCA|nr:redox-sensing transcriptional repressor Rex [Nocardia ninae]GEM44189.1 redox-sensing transcriptional repressor Rex [Nocardia ninae NBRC 108245]
MTEQHEAPGGVSGRALQKDIPQATVARLATYLRVLATLADEGVAIVSSEELAVAAGVNSAKLRKDLSFLGPNGVRGVGYDVARLRARIEDVLGLSQGHRVVLVGAGNLGRALVGYGGFQRRGFTVVGIFDNHPEVIGLSVAGLVVRDVAGLAEAVEALEPTIAVITVPDDAAQDACDRLVAAGLQSILSFAPCELIAPATVELRRVDLAVELQMLSFERVRNADNASEARVNTETPTNTEAARPAAGRLSRRAPTAHTSAIHQALKHSAAAHTASSHTATEPSSKGSVVTP